MTINEILQKKRKAQRITMLTAYDYPTAKLVDEAGIDIVLVGDSLANVVLGLATTREVGMDEMIHHARAVRRGVKRALLVGDMPYGSYQADVRQAVFNAERFVSAAGCDAVKLEWFDGCLQVAEAIVKAGIPVMGHVGLTPQTADQLGGFKVQGKDAATAKEIMRHAQALEKKGCFGIVLECIPDKIAQLITRSLSIPTIGIGAGRFCDGQVLVIHDLLGLFDRFRPKFVKRYANLSPLILKAVQKYRREVVKGKFPDRRRSYSMKASEFKRLKKIV